MASKRLVELKRTEPPPWVTNVRTSVGNSFPVTASILADNIAVCQVSLRFDDLALEETTGNPNPRTVLGAYVQEEVQWQLRGRKPAVETSVRIVAEGNGLPQLSEFTVEVTQ